jgi:ABC-type glycerol-3-phosphate transport system substrate-binding protein
LAVLAALLLTGACAPAAPTPGPTAAAVSTPAAPHSAPNLSGSIQFYPNNYYNPQAQPQAATTVENVVKQYMANNPGATIQLVPYVGDPNQYRPWLLTRLSAGQAPNITWEQYSDRNTEKDQVWVPLTSYLEQPNPYVPAGQPGSVHWKDEFPDYVLAQIRASDGQWYEISMDWVETGLFYNTALLDKAGVQPNWKTWGDLLNDCQKLKASGVDPVGIFITPQANTYQWLDDVAFSSAFADEGPQWYLSTYDVPGRAFRRLNPEETAKAIHDGKLSTSDPRFDTYLTLVKQFTDACAMKGFAGGLAYADMPRLFADQKVAMVWLSTADAAALRTDAKFDYGLTYLPPITKADNPYSVNETSSYRVGGPSGPGQWGITQATAKAGQLDLAVNFLQYWSAPQAFQQVYDFYPVQVPVVNGVQPSDIAKQFQFVAAMPERLIGDPIARLTPQFGTEHLRLFQQYLLGEIDATSLKQQYQPLLQKGCRTPATRTSGPGATANERREPHPSPPPWLASAGAAV